MTAKWTNQIASRKSAGNYTSVYRDAWTCRSKKSCDTRTIVTS